MKLRTAKKVIAEEQLSFPYAPRNRWRTRLAAIMRLDRSMRRSCVSARDPHGASYWRVRAANLRGDARRAARGGA